MLSVKVTHVASVTAGLGLMQTLGTVDFYPSGGHDMPGCPNTYFARVTNVFIGNFGKHVKT